MPFNRRTNGARKTPSSAQCCGFIRHYDEVAMPVDDRAGMRDNIGKHALIGR